MTTPNSSVAFSQRDKALIDDFRAHGGAVTQGVHTGRTVLLLTTTGAKTGEPRIAPLVYTRDGDSYVIVGSKGGAPAHPAWYHNLVADPVVTVEVGRETIAAQATVTEGAERDRLFAAHVAEFPYFAGYQKKTSRVIPVVLLERIGQTRNGPAAGRADLPSTSEAHSLDVSHASATTTRGADQAQCP